MLAATDSLTGEEHDTSDDGTPPPPAVQSVEFSRAGPSGKARYVYQTSSTENLDALITNWSSLVHLQQPAEGNWLWTMPLPAGTIKEADLLVSQDMCSGTAVHGLDLAARGDSPVVSAHTITSELIAASQAGRARLSARGPHGELWYGALYTD